VLTHTDPPNRNECSKNQFKKSRWRTTAIFKNIKWDLSAAVLPILMKFGVVMHLRPLNLMAKNFKISKSKMVDGPSLKSKNCNIS